MLVGAVSAPRHSPFGARESLSGGRVLAKALTMRNFSLVWVAMSVGLVFGCERSRNESTTTSAAPSASVALTPPAPSASVPLAVASASSAASASDTPSGTGRVPPHFGSSVGMRKAIVKGDLEAFRESAAKMADTEASAPVADSWKPHVESMRAAAKRARDAKTMGAATVALGDVGVACANCHEKLGGPKVALTEPVAAGSGDKARLAHHHWAAAELWEGLMAPSQDAWMKGADVLTEAPLTPDVADGGKPIAPEVAELAKRAHAFGQKAHLAKDAATRTKAVADLYGTCVECHKKTNVTVK